MTESQANPIKRPRWVWVVSILYFFSAAWTLLSFYLIYSGAIRLDPQTQAYLDTITPLDRALTLVILTLNVAGAVALFLLRRRALQLFLAALSINLAISAWHVTTRGFAATLSGSGLMGLLVGWLVAGGVCLYTWSLARKGILH